MSTIDTSNAYLDSMRWQKEPVKVDDGSNQTLDQEDFLRLLTEQLAMQDPSKPVDNDQMISQMASFSTVEGISQMTNQFEDLNSVMTSSQALQASSLVGQKVLIPANVGHVKPGESIEAVISLPEATPGMSVRIENETGELIKTIKLANMPAGNNEFTWDGTNEKGEAVPEGNYSIKATGSVGGEQQELAVSTYSHVASVSLGNSANGVVLNLRGLGNISLNEVLAVAEG
ncbi:flagellar hook assembly protein FlgD [Psychrobium sp. 1_MG-2023]|uniref:flagellar hook assembly protein FlgD n=1 Tax=Psychrobium sp. 1_MG-2023 TaxID=3062624 RepID=UPI000C33D0B4|nr:flagellar hook assembly protein FlgD [Psychrobium sp. 1_MG-2023]MDP2559871.1 flagellar hook assembly protein FlgD [Psychrobium sp. 1_MG-2023]PKF59028.1 flagellar biosynthesis protein FlgD [Alteromonadales bacterium alter-6D02]